MSSRRDDAIIASVLGSLVLLVYAGALGAGFYSDDYTWLGRMAPTLERPTYVFSIFYRDFNPVLHASFVLDWAAGGGATAVFHATSLLIHALNTILLYFLCRRHTGNLWIAAGAALTWGLNVRLSEAVIWTAARGHSLATFFVLAALLCLGSDEARRRRFALPLFLLALLSKETALFPLLLAPLFIQRQHRDRVFAVTVVALASAFVAFNLFCKQDLDLSFESPATQALKIPFILLRPLGLGDLYDFTWPVLAIVGLAFLGFAALLRRSAAARIGMIWVVACLVPIVPLARLSSRYLYMLSIGYALVLCGACEMLAASLRAPRMRRAVAGLATAGLAVMLATGVLSIAREIEDYDFLSWPYEACVEALRNEARLIQPGATLIVIDMSDRQTVPALNRLIEERGGIRKLIPNRPAAIGGLIELPDILNMVSAPARGGGLFATPVDPKAAGDAHFVMYDGRWVRPVAGFPAQPLPRERVLAARLGPAQEYFVAR